MRSIALLPHCNVNPVTNECGQDKHIDAVTRTLESDGLATTTGEAVPSRFWPAFFCIAMLLMRDAFFGRRRYLRMPFQYK